jgi:ribose transport system substrate-binding protein
MKKGINGPLPASAPHPVPGKKVWIISFLESDPGGHVLSEGTKEAVAAAGWTPTVFDGAGDPSKWQAGIRLAASAKADAVIILAFDCAPVKGAIEEAKAAGIKLAGVYAADCPGKPLLDTTVTYAGLDERPVDYSAWAKLIGLGKGWLIVDATGGKADTIVFNVKDLAAPKAATDLFLQDNRKCTGCTVHEVSMTLSDLGPGVTAKAQAALLRNPNANSVFIPFDGVGLSVAPAVVESGRKRSLFVVGNEGNAPSLDLIRRNSGQDASMGIPHAWSGWAVVDGLVRLFAGQDQVPSGMGLYAVDAHNVPASGGFVPPVDFRANYRKIWGVR